MPNYIDLIRARLPAMPFGGRLGERFAGLLGGLTHNMLAEAASLAVQAKWLIAGQPGDVLSYQGSERSLRRYIAEIDDDVYRARLERAVEIWEAGGSEDELLRQFIAAGYTAEGGAEDPQIHSPLDWNRPPYNWPSQFWVFIPRAAHLDGTPFHTAGTGVTAGSLAAIAGTGTYFKHAKRLSSPDAVIGDAGHLIGITGPVERVVELQHIVRTFKAGHEVCRQILIEIRGQVCGTTNDAHTRAVCGTHLCGSTVVAIGMGVPET